MKYLIPVFTCLFIINGLIFNIALAQEKQTKNVFNDSIHFLKQAWENIKKAFISLYKNSVMLLQEKIMEEIKEFVNEKILP